jgi:14-3-3 protein epsilon
MSTFRLPEKREHLIVTAKLAEQCERYDEMLVCMKRVVKLSADLSAEERNLLSVAYKNVIGSRRACWRAISSLESKEDIKRAGGQGSHVPLIRSYKAQIEAELGEICADVLSLLDKYIIPSAPSEEAKVYFYKMKGDYHRYFAEIDNGDEQKEKAHESYTKATELSHHLKATSPIRLGLALNFSVFYYEILKSPDRGCQLARQAFEEALNDPEVLDEEQHKEAALIMQLLRDNLALWMEEDPSAPDDDGTKCEELDG